MLAKREIRKLSLGNHEFIEVEVPVLIFNDLPKQIGRYFIDIQIINIKINEPLIK
jgi:hypothetical protein